MNSVWRRPYSDFLSNNLAAPILIAPANNSTGISVTPALTWNNVADATGYRVMVSDDANFTNIIHNVTVASNQHTIPGSILNQNTKYYWKVAGQNTNGQGQFSTIWNFTTMPQPPANQWTSYPTGVPYSLFAVDFYQHDIYSPTNELLGLAVGQGGTVLRTTDAGDEWTLVYQNINIWLNDVKWATDKIAYAAGMGGVIIKTTDAGVTWTVIRAYDTPLHTFRGIAVDEDYNPNKVTFVGYAGTYFETTNGGTNWIERTDIPWTMHSIDFASGYSSNGRGIISGTDGYIWNTTNWGANWVVRPEVRNAGIYDYLNDVVFVSSKIALICGNNG
ncbi:MAG: hypothetical protein NTV87_14840, partial [Ignavibacteriae bacterium]|nr:hypothetical protein [Ignavibacteriota bacterium]